VAVTTHKEALASATTLGKPCPLRTGHRLPGDDV